MHAQIEGITRQLTLCTEVMYIYTYVYVICINTCIYVYMYICMYTYTCMFVCTCFLKKGKEINKLVPDTCTHRKHSSAVDKLY